MSFYQRLLIETQSARHDFQSIGLIQTAIQNGVTRDMYAKYLEQAYHHVRYTVPLLELALDHCEVNETAYANALAEYITEEEGHDEWILDDLRALGADAEAVRHGRGNFANRMMIAYAHYAIEHVSPYALLGMVHVLEGMSVELAHKAAGSIRESLKDDQGNVPGAFSYLTSHGALDVGHVQFFEDLVNGIQDPETEAVIIDAAKDFYRLFGDMFRELETDLAQQAT